MVGTPLLRLAYRLRSVMGVNEGPTSWPRELIFKDLAVMSPIPQRPEATSWEARSCVIMIQLWVRLERVRTYQDRMAAHNIVRSPVPSITRDIAGTAGSVCGGPPKGCQLSGEMLGAWTLLAMQDRERCWRVWVGERRACTAWF